MIRRTRNNWAFGPRRSDEDVAEPSSAAVRQRLARQRRAVGAIAITLEIGRDEIAGLIARGLLDAGDAENRSAIAHAVKMSLRLTRDTNHG
jgi:hypothetical protein